MSPELELREITKRFPGVLANDHVSLSVEKGEIRALVGENGAGKSTLVKILYGLYRPDDGDIRLRGRPVAFHSPHEAIRAGLGMVHQHFMLFPSLSAFENVIYGDEITTLGFIDARQARRRVRELSEHYGLAIDPDARVAALPVGTRQRVEIVKTLFRNADILILDEPTAVLTPQEEEELFGVLRRLAADGKTIIFITHKLNEVMQISDRATVLRDGKVVTTLDTARTSPAALSFAMVGRDVLLRVDKTARPPGDVVLEVRGLCVQSDRGMEAVHDASFTVRAGQIVGIAGVAGNGQNELIEAVSGLRPIDRGHVTLRGREVTRAGIGARREAGLAYIPEDRSAVGLALGAQVAENLAMGYQHTPSISRRGWLDSAGLARHAGQLIARFGIRAASQRELMANLSGGNRQKSVVARELSHASALLIAEQPTWGVDVGSIEFIHRQLLEYRQLGHAVLLVSADLSEVMALSDRILVMFEGRIVGEVPASDATEQGLGLLMTGAGVDRDRHQA
jgi:simple sugar transport system ATP-binding protein